MAVIVMIAGLSFPFYRNFFQGQQLQASADELVGNLRRAQTKSMANEFDSTWGVNFESGYYTIYATESSDYNEEIDYLSSVSISASDILFDQLTGLPDASQTITLTDSSINETKEITINTQGLISY